MNIVIIWDSCSYDPQEIFKQDSGDILEIEVNKSYSKLLMELSSLSGKEYLLWSTADCPPIVDNLGAIRLSSKR